MLQPSTGRDLTAPMKRFAARFLGGIGDPDGFILKSRSPSCGVWDAKLFDSDTADAHRETGAGLFAARVLERFPHAAVEDESRLSDPRVLHEFLTRVYAHAAARVR